MIPAQVQAIVNKELALQAQITPSASIDECPRCNEPVMDGTGAHLDLRNPWYNDLSHEITDSTLFRLLLIYMVVDFVLNKLGD